MIRFLALRFFTPLSLAFALFAVSLHAGGDAFARAQQTLKAADIEQRALQYLEERIPWDPEMTEVVVQYKGKDLVLPAGNLELKFRVPGSVMRTGRFSMSASVIVGRAVKKKLRLEAQVIRSVQVIRTIRPVNRGEILTAQDVSLDIIQTNRNFRGAATRLQDVVGFETVRNLVEGKPIRVSSLRKPPLVSKGDQVTLIAESGSMKITAPGIVQDKKGFRDSLVQVLNLQTKKKVYGRVVDSQTIKVNF